MAELNKVSCDSGVGEIGAAPVTSVSTTPIIDEGDSVLQRVVAPVDYSQSIIRRVEDMPQGTPTAVFIDSGKSSQNSDVVNFKKFRKTLHPYKYLSNIAVDMDDPAVAVNIGQPPSVGSVQIWALGMPKTPSGSGETPSAQSGQDANCSDLASKGTTPTAIPLVDYVISPLSNVACATIPESAIVSGEKRDASSMDGDFSPRQQDRVAKRAKVAEISSPLTPAI